MQDNKDFLRTCWILFSDRPQVINKKSFEALICSGSMDDLHHLGSKGRNEMLATYESFLLLTEQRELAKDQGSLFGEIPWRKI